MSDTITFEPPPNPWALTADERADLEGAVLTLDDAFDLALAYLLLLGAPVDILHRRDIGARVVRALEAWRSDPRGELPEGRALDTVLSELRSRGEVPTRTLAGAQARLARDPEGYAKLAAKLRALAPPAMGDGRLGEKLGALEAEHLRVDYWRSEAHCLRRLQEYRDAVNASQGTKAARERVTLKVRADAVASAVRIAEAARRACVAAGISPDE